MQAADQDRLKIDAKVPATAKLTMLDEVMRILRKWVSLHLSSRLYNTLPSH
jgi:hypothetical protein